MQRQLFVSSRTGNQKFLTTRSVEGSTVGIIGAGNIGGIIARTVQMFSPLETLYFNRSAKDVPASRVELDELITRSDIIFLTLPLAAGRLLDAERIVSIKHDALLVSISPNNLIDYDALLPRLKDGTLRAAIDWPSPSAAYSMLPLDVWFSVNSHSAYNTHQALTNVNESITRTALDLLAR